jgi:hypothetical protein
VAEEEQDHISRRLVEQRAQNSASTTFDDNNVSRNESFFLQHGPEAVCYY